MPQGTSWTQEAEFSHWDTWAWSSASLLVTPGGGEVQLGTRDAWAVVLGLSARSHGLSGTDCGCRGRFWWARFEKIHRVVYCF